jgi:hypothetical protein
LIFIGRPTRQSALAEIGNAPVRLGCPSREGGRLAVPLALNIAGRLDARRVIGMTERPGF